MDKTQQTYDLASYVDHTLLKPDATPAQIQNLCQEAREYSFRTVCVNSSYVPLCAKELAGSKVDICSVIGFPLGAMATLVKSAEAAWAIDSGATEIDMVCAIGQLIAGNLDYVRNDIEEVYKSCGDSKLKVIIETSLLNDKQKESVCILCKEIGVAFVKTSTGFADGGATTEDVALMKSIVGDSVEVKASGGVRSYEDAVKMIDAGASRLGTSSGIALLQGETGSSDY